MTQRLDAKDISDIRKHLNISYYRARALVDKLGAQGRITVQFIGARRFVLADELPTIEAALKEHGNAGVV